MKKDSKFARFLRHIAIRFSILMVIAVIILISAKPAFVIIAKHQMRKSFPRSQVKIGHVSMNIFRSIRMMDVMVTNKKTYDFEAKEVGIEYDMSSISRQAFKRCYVKGAAISVNAPKAILGELFKKAYIPENKSAFIVEALDVSGLKVDVKTRDVLVDGEASFGLNLARKRPRFFDINIGSLNTMLLHAKDVKLSAQDKDARGLFSVKEVKIGKVVMRDITGTTRVDIDRLLIETIAGSIFNGNIQGDCSIAFFPKPQYTLTVKAVDIDANKIISDFGIYEKVDMAGTFEGDIAVEGSGAGLSTIIGSFASTEKGGTFIIKDEELLKSLAERTKQPLEIIKESFKNYRFTKGDARLGMEGNDLLLYAMFDGENGKREISVTIHEFKK